MDVSPEEELFERLAVALGESLEQVYSMPDVERRQLIEVLNLEGQRGGEAAISMDGESCGNSNEKARVGASQEEKKCGKEVEVMETPAVTEGDLGGSEASVGFDEKVSLVSPLERRLKEDTARVRRLLKGTTHETIDEEILEAYLQAHSDNPDRVKVVLEELAEVGACPDDDIPLPDVFTEEEFQDKGKGKGKGKSTTSKRAFPEVEVDPVHEGDNGGNCVENERENKQRKLEVGLGGEIVVPGGAAEDERLLVEVKDANTGRKSNSDAMEETALSNEESPEAQTMPTVLQACEQWRLNDVDLEYSDADYSNLITFKLFQQTFGPRIQAENPKVSMSKLMMLVTAKWREFTSLRPAEEEEKEEDAEPGPSSVSKQTVIHPEETNLPLKLRNIKELVGGPESDARLVEQDAAKVRAVEVEVPGLDVERQEEVPVNLQELSRVNLGQKSKQKEDNDKDDEQVIQLLRQQQAPVKDRVYSPEVRGLAENFSVMFPHTPLSYLLHKCDDLVDKPAAIDRFTEELLHDPKPPSHWGHIGHFVGPVNVAEGEVQPVAGTSSGSPVSTPKKALNRLEVWEGECLDQLKSMFPDVCPEHLLTCVQDITPAAKERVGEEETGADINRFQQLVESLFNQKQNLPTRKEYEARRKEQMEVKNWAGAMTAARFLQLYPDPKEYFTGAGRNTAAIPGYTEHVLADLLLRYPYHGKHQVDGALRKSKLYIPTAKHLQLLQPSRTKKRRSTEIPIPRTSTCLEFLKEKKYFELEKEIAQLKLDKEKEQKQLLEDARAAGLLVECEICFKDDCLEQEMVPCKANHLHCAECIAQAAKVAAGENKTGVACPQCDEEVEWRHLDKVVDPLLLSKMLQRRQAEEVSGAGLEGLVKCPFCHYCAVMENPEDKVLICRNSGCGRESCRLCKESNHVPLRCDEVEKTEGTRKEIEEKLTQAMIRECWKCNKKFFKEEGCNKMTCTCGAQMCYICKAEGVEYSHFYGQGGEATATKTCPLWSDNMAIHEEELAKAAEEARQKLKQDNVTLDVDPLKGIGKPAAEQTKEQIREGLFKRWYSLKAEVNQLNNPQHKTHLDTKLDKLLKKLQVDDLPVQDIKRMLQRWSDLVRHCQRQPRYVFPEYRQVVQQQPIAGVRPPLHMPRLQPPRVQPAQPPQQQPAQMAQWMAMFGVPHPLALLGQPPPRVLPVPALLGVQPAQRVQLQPQPVLRPAPVVPPLPRGLGEDLGMQPPQAQQEPEGAQHQGPRADGL